MLEREQLEVIETLIASFKTENLEIKQQSLEQLQYIGRPAVMPLIAALNDENKYVRSWVIETLGKIGDAKAVEPLISALKDVDGNVRFLSVLALGKIGDAKAVEPLISALKGSDTNVRSSAADVLGNIGDTRAVEPLITALEDSDNDVRLFVASALGKIGDERALPTLEIFALKDKEKTNWGASVSAVAVWAIKEIKARHNII